MKNRYKEFIKPYLKVVMIKKIMPHLPFNLEVMFFYLF